MRRALPAVAMALMLTGPAAAVAAGGETMVEIASRGQAVRALLIEPARPVGGVILLAGGSGRLDLGPDGALGGLKGNQLVRTRALYADAGYVTLVPDIAADLKTPTGVAAHYREEAPHARDLGAMVRYLRRYKVPVVVVGTSRGTLSAANAVARLKGAERPDAMALTSALMLPTKGKRLSVQSIARDPARLGVPTLLVHHKRDACRVTLPSAVAPFTAWYEKGGRRLDVIWLDGGDGTGDPCEGGSAHGFAGLDDKVVATVTGWIAAQKLAPR